MDTIEFQCPYCERISKVPRSFAGKQGKCPGCLELLEVPDPDAVLAPQDEAPKGAPASVGAPAPADPDTAETVLQPASELAVTVPPPSADTVPPPLPVTMPPPLPASGEGDDVEASDDEAIPAGPTEGQVIGTPVEGISERLTITPAAVERSAEQERAERHPCPSCGEAIKRVAKKCRFCGEFLDRELARRRRRPGIGRLALASPGARLAAWAIDFVMFWGPAIGLGVGGAALVDTSSTELIGGILFLFLGVHVLFLTGYNWYLIAKRGQTIGKRWLGLRIVKDTGAPVDFVTGVLLRNWITGVLGSLLLSWIGCLFWVIDSCMIFGQERRCLHDHIASTRVVEIPGRRGRRSAG